MADAMHLRTGLRVLIKFLTVEGSSPIEIHRNLRIVCDENAIDVGLVTGSIKNSEEDIGDRPHIGQPATAVTSETVNGPC
jgi:hypothetical protein